MDFEIKALEALTRVIGFAEVGLSMMEAVNGVHPLNSERDAMRVVKIVAKLELLEAEVDKAVRQEIKRRQERAD